jgi:hypothetical protein
MHLSLIKKLSLTSFDMTVGQLPTNGIDVAGEQIE